MTTKTKGAAGKAAGTGPKSTSRRTEDSLRGRVRAHDPFELIRWLALSQTDPRKALAELVQNSLDASSTRIRIVRLREKGAVCLRVVDNGEGPIPDKDRRDALSFIATNIGHSQKRSLSPEQRLQLMTQGQYGIGLLGFWAIGQKLEMRSVLPGQKAHRLVLHRDSPDFVIEAMRGRLELEERRTEVVVVGVHPEVQSALSARRISEYLASELRGQLLARSVTLEVEDKIARGRSQKWFEVAPRRFLGRRIEGAGAIVVPGHVPAQVELYYLGDDVSEDVAVPIAVYAAGTMVASSFHELSELGLDRHPWTDRRFTGFVDFSDFTIAPGSRRGVMVDTAAEAFARAIAAVEPVLQAVIEERERARVVEQDRNLIRNLQRAFRNFYRNRPRYDLLPVADAAVGGHGPGQGPGTGGEPGPEDASNDATRPQAEQLTDLEPPAGEAAAGRNGEDPDLAEDDPSGAASLDDSEAGESASSNGDEGDPSPPVERELFLFPPGPITAVRFVPKSHRIPVDSEKTIRAEAIDAAGRVVRDLMEFDWRLEGECGTLVESGGTEFSSISDTGMDEVHLRAADVPRTGRLRVEVRTDQETVQGEVVVKIVEGGAARGEGIPEPEFLDAPGSNWRSRMEGARWQVNSGHPDYRRTTERPTLRLRYLALLFAKEVVLRSHRDPRMELALEQMVEVSAFADRNLSPGRERGS
jgi:hypothetical protein